MAIQIRENAIRRVSRVISQYRELKSTNCCD